MDVIWNTQYDEIRVWIAHRESVKVVSAMMAEMTLKLMAFGAGPRVGLACSTLAGTGPTGAGLGLCFIS
jgi:hypothetical protein